MTQGQILGYVRVSTVEQNEARQVEALTARGVQRWYIDKASGKSCVSCWTMRARGTRWLSTI